MDVIYLSPSRLAATLKALLPVAPGKFGIFIVGKPGCGKTSIPRQVAQELGLECPFLPPVPCLDPVDLRGVPKVTDNRTTWCVPDFWPGDPDWKGVLLLDEFAQADDSLQKAFGQLLPQGGHKGSLGNYSPPDGSVFVATGNRVTDRAGVRKTLSHIMSRFVWLGLETSVEDWRNWALDKGLRPEVTAFIPFRPGLLNTFDETSPGELYACERGWERVSHVVDANPPEDLLLPTVAGIVGRGPAAEFVAFCQIYQNLPNIDEVLKNPTTSRVPTEPAVLYALSGALSERARSADNSLLNNMLVYANRMPAEFGVLTVRDAAALNQRAVTVPAARDFLKKHKDVLFHGSR